MFMELSQGMLGWFSMTLVMGYFIWQELQEKELELEEEDEPPSTNSLPRLVVPVTV